MDRSAFAGHAFVCAVGRGCLCVSDGHTGVAEPIRRPVGDGRDKRTGNSVRCWRGVRRGSAGCGTTRIVFDALPVWPAERRHQVCARRAIGHDVCRISTRSGAPDCCQRFSSTDRDGLDSALGSASRDPALLFSTLILRSTRGRLPVRQAGPIKVTRQVRPRICHCFRICPISGRNLILPKLFQVSGVITCIAI
jgi:hypothetical protein